jgi:hypothetical protein
VLQGLLPGDAGGKINFIKYGGSRGDARGLASQTVNLCLQLEQPQLWRMEINRAAVL